MAPEHLLGCQGEEVLVAEMLKAHQQICKKWCFKKYCLCDEGCQFSALKRVI